jgi:hypothetical protein
MRQRYLLSLLCAIAMLYYALPQLPFFKEDMFAQIFALTWFLFALVVIGGNLSAILYQAQTVKKQPVKRVSVEKRGKVRSYH